MNDFYQKTGTLILGTRLKRLSNKFLQEITQVYREEDIPFEPSWFPIFFLLKNGEERSLTDLAQELEVSHSAISQMSNNLKKRGLLTELADPDDGRRKHVRLSKQGEELLNKVKPVWWAIEQVVEDILGAEGTAGFFRQLDRLDEIMLNKRLSQSIRSNISPSSFRFVKVEELEKDIALQLFSAENRLEGLDSIRFLGKALFQNTIIGLIAFDQNPDNASVHLKELFIRNGFRRKGVGTELLRWGLQELNVDKNGEGIQLKKVNIPLLHLLLKENITFKVLGKQ